MITQTPIKRPLNALSPYLLRNRKPPVVPPAPAPTPTAGEGLTDEQKYGAGIGSKLRQAIDTRRENKQERLSNWNVPEGGALDKYRDTRLGNIENQQENTYDRQQNRAEFIDKAAPIAKDYAGGTIDALNPTHGGSFVDINPETGERIPKERVSEAIDALNPYDVGAKVNEYYDETRQFGPGGERYAGVEDTGIERLGEMGAQDYAQETFGNVLDFQKGLQGNKTAAEQALEESDLAAIQGNLTDPGNQYYQAMKAQMDINSEDEMNRMREELGAKRMLGGGRADQAMIEAIRRQTADKNALLTKTQMDEKTAARNTLLQNKELNNLLTGIVSNLAAKLGDTQLGAQNKILDHVTNQTTNATNQAKLKLDTDVNKFNAEMDALKGKMTDEQWQYEYDARYKDMINDNLNNWVTSLMDSFKKSSAGGGGKDWTQMLYNYVA